MKSGGIAVLGVVLLIAGAFALVLTQPPPGKQARVAEARCEPSPEHDCLPTVGVTDTSGLTWTNEALAGKVVVINFWATWCKPCVHEVPLLTETYERYKADGLVLLSVLTDDVSDDELAAFSAEHGLHYPVVRANEAIYEAFGYPDGLPTTIVYGRDGERAQRFLGPVTKGQVERSLRPLLDAR